MLSEELSDLHLHTPLEKVLYTWALMHTTHNDPLKSTCAQIHGNMSLMVHFQQTVPEANN